MKKIIGHEARRNELQSMLAKHLKERAHFVGRISESPMTLQVAVPAGGNIRTPAVIKSGDNNDLSFENGWRPLHITLTDRKMLAKFEAFCEDYEKTTGEETTLVLRD